MASKCQIVKVDGTRCMTNAQPNGFCVFHDPSRVEQGRRARRAGGLTRSRTVAVLPPTTPDLLLKTATDVSDLMADSINRLRRGQLDPKIASTIGYLASVHLRSLEQSAIEKRLTQIEYILGIVPISPVAQFNRDLEEGEHDINRESP